MSSPEKEWWTVRAGEYVLGTLDPKARELFERILLHDRDLQRSVRDWERILAPLDDATPAREPPARLWSTIERRLHDEPPAPDPVRGIDLEELDGPRDSVPVSSPSPSPSAPSPDPPRAPPRSGRLTLLASALAVVASLVAAGLLYQQQRRLDAALQVAGVSVILDEDGAPLWLVEADFDAERVRVTALRPPSVDGSRDYQLWQVLPDGAGVSAVTLLPEDEGDSRTAAVPGLAERFDAFAVSLEPAGGASGSVPSGEVLYRAEVFCTDGGTP